MPIELKHPGVYIEEVSSGVRTITGVATSTAAFVGRAPRGPVGVPITLTSYGDYVREFGGLWKESALGFAVKDFFTNGGTTAVIVRLVGANNKNAVFKVANVTLTARSPGVWGNSLIAEVDHDTGPDEPGTTNQFNLKVTDDVTGAVEVHRNLVPAPVDHPRYVVTALEFESRLVTATITGSNRPAKAEYKASASPAADRGKDGNEPASTEIVGDAPAENHTGLYALDKVDIFNLLVIPPFVNPDANIPTTVIKDAAAYCEKRRAMLILDAPNWTAQNAKDQDLEATIGTVSKNAALFFPRLREPNPLKDGAIETFPAAGAVAGVIARTDAQRGVWKAPAGLDAGLVGVPQLEQTLTDGDIGQLNPLGINCLRTVPGVGRVVWGARTMQGNDRVASEWKYLPVRRTALFIEESLFRGTQWVVFEPNDEPLWAQIRLNIGSFMTTLFRQGAFAGVTPREAFFVKCDRETTTQDDVNLGIVNIRVGFAPLKPAEFVVIRLQQMAGLATA